MTEDRPTVLLTGGAGYIGSHVVLALRDRGLPCVVVDDLSTGHRDLLPDDVPLLVADVRDRDAVAPFCREHRVDAILHFAGSIRVEESTARPLDYYDNNVCASRALIDLAAAQGIRHFVFSSTAMVYGDTGRVPLAETAPLAPTNPYGRSKLMVEWMLADAAAAHGLHPAVLRYFNVAGADPQGRSGQRTFEATHLIKIACEAAIGRRPGVTVFGDDYPTDDGTCVRDYVHVSDLAEAHVLALEHLRRGGAPLTLNCGYGHGHSVRQVLDAVARSAGHPLDITVGPRRAGDVPNLTADASAIRRTLGWTPRHDDLDAIVGSALAWEHQQKDTPA